MPVELVRKVTGVFSELHKTAERFRLTAAEIQVLGLLAKGLSDREIAQRLFVSRETVHTHVGHLFGKLGVCSRVQAALLAHGLLLDGVPGPDREFSGK